MTFFFGRGGEHKGAGLPHSEARVLVFEQIHLFAKKIIIESQELCQYQIVSITCTPNFQCFNCGKEERATPFTPTLGEAGSTLLN
jgi:hypothetical protein